jgi:acyl carrier protein
MTEALNQAVLASVIRILRQACHLPDQAITLDTRFIEDLGLDSLDLVELTMELEAAFDLELPDDGGQRFGSVGQVVAYLSARYFHDTSPAEDAVEEPWSLAA